MYQSIKINSMLGHFQQCLSFPILSSRKQERRHNYLHLVWLQSLLITTFSHLVNIIELADRLVLGLVPSQEQMYFGVKEEVRVKGIDLESYQLVQLEYFILAPKLVQKHPSNVQI